jgi:hypothetical protein
MKDHDKWNMLIPTLSVSRQLILLTVSLSICVWTTSSNTLSDIEENRKMWQGTRARIAIAQAYNEAFPMNTTVLPFGPQEYLAPFDCYDYPDEDLVKVPGAYLVDLCHNHSLKLHRERVKVDIRPFIRWTWPFRSPGVEFSYTTIDADEEVLAAIRRDEGVQLVFCDYASDPGWDGEESFEIGDEVGSVG